MKTRSFKTVYGQILLYAAPLAGDPSLGIWFTVAPHALYISDGRQAKQIRLRAGIILMSRRDPEAPANPLWLIYPSVYHALRACLRIRENYRGPQGEKAKLEQAHYALQAIVQKLLTDYPRLSIHELTALSQQINDWANHLEKACNPSKQEAREKLAAAQNITDKLGRRNPGATNARLTAARSRLIERLWEISGLDPFIGLRQLALVREKERCLGILYAGYPLLFRIQTCLNRKYPPRLYLLRRWRDDLCIFLDQLSTIRIGPFGAPVGRMKQEIAEIISALEKKNFSRAKRLLRRVQESIRCKKGQDILNNLLIKAETILDPKNPPNQKERQGIKKDVLDFITRLSSIDDSDFMVKVCDKVKEHLLKAVEALKKDDDKSALPQIKKAVAKL